MAALYKKSVAYHVPVLSALLHFRGGGQGVGSPGEQAAGGGGGGTGDGRRKGGKRDLYDGGKRERKSKRQAFVNCYYSSSSQRNEPKNVS